MNFFKIKTSEKLFSGTVAFPNGRVHTFSLSRSKDGINFWPEIDTGENWKFFTEFGLGIGEIRDVFKLNHTFGGFPMCKDPETILSIFSYIEDRYFKIHPVAKIPDYNFKGSESIPKINITTKKRKLNKLSFKL